MGRRKREKERRRRGEKRWETVLVFLFCSIGGAAGRKRRR
jgi:hypothetical protein